MSLVQEDSSYTLKEGRRGSVTAYDFGLFMSAIEVNSKARCE